MNDGTSGGGRGGTSITFPARDDGAERVKKS